MFRIISGVFKIVVVSLLTGAALSALDLSAADILIELGLTPERTMELLQQGAAWALPNLILGSMVILPIWLVVALLRPPRGP
ncbi:DUF6460 domain-containing protein [Mesorhizobium sp. J428]|uniref:DUF6460 domain-containing protein n=1 Tax=Mesorhizobium sp. J428 TaxID=2898440 RepID=UPI002151D1C8|nr:DUF6460 domain-containing protein [Mesorhizobium sp. J428]MCR5858432.1 DUF6460 domain-containing protein [Mesorhizobium sp. J428]